MRRTMWTSSTDSNTSRVVGVAVVLACALLLAAPAGAQYGKNKVQTHALSWQVLVTPHFDIHFHDGADELAVRAAVIAERAYKEYADRLDRELPFRVPFILYSSHAAFAQTNISDYLIGEGTGGFSEPFRNRVVLPYDGSQADFVHVIRHELVHVFMFDMAYGPRGAELGRNAFFQIPLWFAEGVAEWLSSGWDAEADMVIRDATINDYLVPLDLASGFLVYKEGQAAMRLLSDRYGAEKLNEFWRAVGRQRSVDKALHRVYGLSMEELQKIYSRELRRRYWPDYAGLEQAADIARPLTDHEVDRASYNERPALSPDGDRVVYFTDRDGLLDLVLASAIDGRILRRLGRSMRSDRFESFHSFRSGLTWSPEGHEIALVAKSDNAETLHTIDVETGDVTRSLRLGLDIIANPAWSPDGRTVAVVGTRYGRTDLYLVDLGGDAPLAAADHAIGVPEDLGDGVRLYRLTDDVGDEGSPRWSPDGRRLVFAFDTMAELASEFAVDADGRRTLLWARRTGDANDDTSRTAPAPAVEILDVVSGRRHRLWESADGRREPIWVGPRTLALVDASDGLANLSVAQLDSAGSQVVGERRLTNLLGGIQHLTYSARGDRLVFSAFHYAGYDLYAADAFLAEWSHRQPTGTAPAPVAQAPPRLVDRAAAPDSLLIDPERIGRIEPYRPKFRLDASQALAGGSVYWTSAGGLGLANIITLSDDLGDRRLDILLNFYGSFDNSDLAFTYTRLDHRINLSGGAFLLNNYYNSVLTSVGELLTNDTLFKEKNYGVFGRASYPLSTFDRIDLTLQAMRSERTLYDVDNFGFLVPTDRRNNLLLEPELDYVHDNALYGLHGPMLGSRWSASFSRTVPLGDSGLDRWTGVFDLRKYWLPLRRNSLALHVTYARSDGADPRAFIIGGPWTLRGYRYYDYQTLPALAGSKLALFSLEYRLPLVDYLIFGWPARWGITGIGGALYFDAGSAWTDRVKLFGSDDSGRWGMDELHGDVGLGLRFNFLFLPVKLDWAWRTDLRKIGGNIFQFSIGPDF